MMLGWASAPWAGFPWGGVSAPSNPAGSIAMITAYSPPGWAFDSETLFTDQWVVTYQLPFNPTGCGITFGFSPDGTNWTWYLGSFQIAGTVYLATCVIDVSSFVSQGGATYQCMVRVTGGPSGTTYYPLGTFTAV